MKRLDCFCERATSVFTMSVITTFVSATASEEQASHSRCLEEQKSLRRNRHGEHICRSCDTALPQEDSGRCGSKGVGQSGRYSHSSRHGEALTAGGASTDVLHSPSASLVCCGNVIEARETFTALPSQISRACHHPSEGAYGFPCSPAAESSGGWTCSNRTYRVGNQNEKTGGSNLAGEHLQSLSLRRIKLRRMKLQRMKLRSMKLHSMNSWSMNLRRMNLRNLNESRAMLHVVNRSGVPSMLRRATAAPTLLCKASMTKVEPRKGGEMSRVTSPDFPSKLSMTKPLGRKNDLGRSPSEDRNHEQREPTGNAVERLRQRSLLKESSAEPQLWNTTSPAGEKCSGLKPNNRGSWCSIAKVRRGFSLQMTFLRALFAFSRVICMALVILGQVQWVHGDSCAEVAGHVTRALPGSEVECLNGKCQLLILDMASVSTANFTWAANLLRDCEQHHHRRRLVTQLTNANIHDAVRAWLADEANATSVYGHISNWDTSEV